MRPSSRLLSADPTARSSTWRVWATLALVFALVGGVFVFGDLAQRRVVDAAARTRAGHGLHGSWRDAAVELYLNLIGSPMVRDVPELLTLGLPVFDLRVDANDLRALHKTADTVTASGLSLGIERPKYDAMLCLDERWTPVRIKLRGLTKDHYNKNHFSFRLKLPKHAMLDGMREVNLLEPYDKGLFVDPVTHEVMARRGLLTARDRWAVVRLNGAVVGLFQMWEHFGRSIFDRNGRPEGIIVGGDGQRFGEAGNFKAKVDAALQQLVRCTPKRDAQPPEGCGWTWINQVFDVDRLAWSMAMSSLLYSTHTWNPDNLRLFWDPAWGRFEPIPWDYSLYPLPSGPKADGETLRRGLSELLLASGPMRHERELRLWILLNEDVPKMMARARERFAALRPALALDRRHLTLAPDDERLRVYLKHLQHNDKVMRRVLSAVRLEVAPGPEPGSLRVANHARSAVWVTAVVLDDGAAVELPSPVTVYGAWHGAPGLAGLRVAVPAGRTVTSLRGRNAIAGNPVKASQVLRKAALPAPAPRPERGPPSVALPEGVTRVTQSPGHLTFGPGEVILRRTLRLPPGVDVTLAPGTTLLLGPKVSLVMEGKLDALGTQAAPILIRALDPKQPFGTVALLGRRTRLPKVRLRHLRVEGGVGGEHERVVFTSAFALHGADVWLRDCTFVDAGSDDGVNFKNARIDIARMRVERSRDDAFDCDFCRGTVRDSVIVQGGADGFDFSGSDVHLINARVEGCGDKGFSIGEHTKAVVEAGDVQRCVTGAASKDLSQLEVIGGHFRDLTVGFAIYVKKGTFGVATLKYTRAPKLERVVTRELREDLGGAPKLGVCPR